MQLVTSNGTIQGTLDLPAGAGPFPAVVIIAGSGPTDRDGNQPAMKNDSLKMLGHGLAAHGIAALRYDKRAIGKSAAAGVREEDLRFETYADDAAAWVELLKKDARFSRVGIVGHSEGSLLGMLAAKRAAAALFVSLAGPGRDAPAVLRQQLATKLPPALLASNEKILGELVAGRTVSDVPTDLAAFYRPSVQPYLISWFRYDPSREIAALTVPVMIVQGTTDLQVSVADAKLLAAAKPDAKLWIVDGMNHVLKSAASNAEQNAAYTETSVPLAPKVVDEIAAFVTR